MKHTHTNEIDAADTGPGAPGSLPVGDLSDEEIAAQKRAFEQRMEQERANPPLFRTPTPQHDTDS